ncbi:MAG: hypothetical protein IT577_23600 [Verrucomicrobiae bacterium]|nr:hypothetical protein [Verrucomicrobiae bacterium]
MKCDALRGFLPWVGLGLLVAACGPKAAPVAPDPLDVRYGFRDIRFGQTPIQIQGIDPARPFLRDATAPDYVIHKRSNEELRVRDVVLEDIRYTFFKNQLMEINLFWEPRSRPDPSAPPPLYHFLTNQFGPPDTQEMSLQRKEFRAIWEANLVRLTLVESAPQGRVKGRGLATLISKPLAAQRDAARGAAPRQKFGF